MAEETTTEATEDAGATIQGVQVDDQGTAVAQPEESDKAEAVETPTEEKPEAEEEPSEDEQLTKFAENKGLQLDSDNAKKAAKMAMNAERAMHQKAQKAGELEKTMTTMSDTSAEQVAEATGQNPEVLKRLQKMEVKESIRDFWEANPDARQYEDKMAEIAVSSGLYGTADAILKASYAMALSQDTDGVKSATKRATLESLAQKQQAAVPRGNATTSVVSSDTITPQNVDQMVAKMDVKEYQRRLPEINAALAQ